MLGGLHTEGVPALSEALLESLAAPEDLIVDLTAVDMCDSAALQMLLACQRSAEAIGKPWRFALSTYMQESARAIGLDLAVISGQNQEEAR